MSQTVLHTCVMTHAKIVNNLWYQYIYIWYIQYIPKPSFDVETFPVAVCSSFFSTGPKRSTKPKNEAFGTSRTSGFGDQILVVGGVVSWRMGFFASFYGPFGYLWHTNPWKSIFGYIWRVLLWPDRRDTLLLDLDCWGSQLIHLVKLAVSNTKRLEDSRPFWTSLHLYTWSILNNLDYLPGRISPAVTLFEIHDPQDSAHFCWGPLLRSSPEEHPATKPG